MSTNEFAEAPVSAHKVARAALHERIRYAIEMRDDCRQSVSEQYEAIGRLTEEINRHVADINSLHATIRALSDLDAH